MGCEGSKTADVSKPAPHHPDGKAHFGGWKPKSKKYQRAIGNLEAAPLVTDLMPAQITVMAAVPRITAMRDGYGGPGMAAVPEAEAGVFEVADGAVAEAAVYQSRLRHQHVLDDATDTRTPHVITSSDMFPDATEVPSHKAAGPMSGDITVDVTSVKTSTLPAAEQISEQSQMTLSNEAFGRFPKASKHFWPLICPGDAALLVKDAVLFGGQNLTDDKSKMDERSIMQFPIFICTPHCRRQCSAGSEAEINTECGTHISGY